MWVGSTDCRRSVKHRISTYLVSTTTSGVGRCHTNVAFVEPLQCPFPRSQEDLEKQFPTASPLHRAFFVHFYPQVHHALKESKFQKCLTVLYLLLKSSCRSFGDTSSFSLSDTSRNGQENKRKTISRNLFSKNLGQMCCSIKYPHFPHRGGFHKNPHLSWNSN